MLCHTCGTNINKDDLCRVVSTVNYIKKYFEEDEDNWEIGVVDDGGVGDKECL